MVPKLRPRGADVATNVDLFAVAESVVDDAIRARESSSNLPGGKDPAEIVRPEAHGYDGLRRRVAVAAEPVGVHAADGAGQAVRTAVKVDGPGFPFVGSQYAEGGAIGGGQRIANLSDGGGELRPAYLHIELFINGVRQAPPRRVDRRDRNHESGHAQAADPERPPHPTQDAHLPLRRK